MTRSIRSCIASLLVLTLVAFANGQDSAADPAEKSQEAVAATQDTAQNKETDAQDAKDTAADVAKPSQEEDTAAKDTAAKDKAKTDKKDDAKSADSKKPATQELKRAPFKIEVKLDGVFDAEDSAPIFVRPEVWTSLQVAKTVEHGTQVKAGDAILWFDTKRLEEQLAEARDGLKVSEIGLKLAEIDKKMTTAIADLNRRSTERTRQQAHEELTYFNEKDRPLSEQSAKFMLRSSEQQLEYVQEELRQLEKMYEADDLTEETEEIILKRAQNDVEYAEYSLTNSRAYSERSLQFTIPRRAEALNDVVTRADLEWEKLAATQPLDRERAELQQQKLKREHAKLKERLGKLEKDLESLTVRAPIDGVVYYGPLRRGRMSDASLMKNRLRKGGSLSPNEVFMTVVAVRPLRIRADLAEKDLHLVKSGKRGRVVAKAYPENKLECRVKRIGMIPLKAGSFDCSLVADDIPADLRIMPGMGCSVTLLAYENRSAITAPKSAVFEDNGDDIVYVDKDGEAERRVVKLGHRNGDKVELVEGVKEGEKIRTKKPE